MAVGLCALMINANVFVSAQDIELEDLTAAEYKALERTNENSVTATLSFLASDEMGGRGTPSPELDIACAYVASRLRGAGAEGLGPDGSFYIESLIDTVITPASGAQFAAGDRKAPEFTLLGGGTSDFNYRGSIPLVDADTDEQLDGAVAVRLDSSSDAGSSVLLELRRTVASLSSKGAKAVVVIADSDHQAWGIAESRQQRERIDSTRSRFEVPVLLVSDHTWTDDTACGLALPADVAQSSVVKNVIGVIRGSDEELADEGIIFSAHLDHLGRAAEGEDRIYNGADDDASGVTAVLTLADTYGALETKPKRSVIFMTFWGEERGLLGSREFVEDSPWPLENVVANINIEMIGRPEDGARNKMWMTGWTESSLGEVVAAGSRRVGVETFEHPSFSARLYRASDNWAFVQKGVIAHSFSAGSLHDDYHQPSDEWEKMDRPHMTQVIRGLFAGTLPIAKGTLTPKDSK